MKFAILCLSLAVALGTSLAEKHACCSTEQAHETQTMWNMFWDGIFDSHTKSHVMKQVFGCLIDKDSAAKKIFHDIGITDPSQARFHAFAAHTLKNIDVAFNLLTDDGPLVKFVNSMVEVTHARGTDARAFKDLPVCWHEVMSQLLSCYNPTAFNSCLGKINRIIYAHRDALVAQAEHHGDSHESESHESESEEGTHEEGDHHEVSIEQPIEEAEGEAVVLPEKENVATPDVLPVEEVEADGEDSEVAADVFRGLSEGGWL